MKKVWWVSFCDHEGESQGVIMVKANTGSMAVMKACENAGVRDFKWESLLLVTMENYPEVIKREIEKFGLDKFVSPDELKAAGNPLVESTD